MTPSSDESERNSSQEDGSETDGETEETTRPLWGGREELQQEQESDLTLRSARRTAGLASSPFYYIRGVLCRAGASTIDSTRI